MTSAPDVIRMQRRAIPVTVWAFGLALAVILTLPTLIGWLRAPAGWAYTGAPAIPAGIRWDYNAQLARMWQGYEPTEALFRLPFTSESHSAIPLVQGFYVALGAVARVAPLSLPALYHAARFALIVALAPALWIFAGRFFRDAATRWIAVLFATVVGGWSWVLLALAPRMTADVSPIEFWLADAYNLLGALYLPHFTAAIILQIAAVLLCDAWIRRPGWLTLGGLTLSLAAQSLIQPYVVPLMAVLLGDMALQAALEKRLALRQALWLALPLGAHGALSLYQYLAMQGDPVWRSFVAQNQTRSPHPIYYLTGYLPLLLPIAAGALSGHRAIFQRRFFIPALWVIAVAFLLYLPIPTQRRYLMGAQTPLAILAAQGWVSGVLPHFALRRRPLITAVFLMLGSISLLLMITANVAAARPAKSPALYLSPAVQQGLGWLSDHAGRDELVLTVSSASEPGSGGQLAAAAGQRVYIGHWIETADFGAKLDIVARFFDPATPDSWRQEFLEAARVQLIWHDAFAREAGAWNPGAAPYLERAFSSDEVAIYRVAQAAPDDTD